MTDVRAAVVTWARWGVTHHDQFTYQEVRPMKLSAKLPWVGDCSTFVTWCYWMAGAPDPNGSGFDGAGYTGTLLDHGQHIGLAQVQPGDAIVYGPGTGWHTALIVEAGDDPLTVSMGQQGDPNYVKVSQDGREPQTYLRFATNSRFPAPKPAPKPAVPLTADLYAARHGMARIDAAEATLAIAHGVSYYVWKGKMIGSRSSNIPSGVILFAFTSALDAAGIPHAGA